MKNELIEQIRILEELKKRKARQNLLDFTEFTYPKYQANWHHIKYAEKLDEFAQGKIKKLMIFMPPQHGKSELSTRRLPAFMLGRNPELKIAEVAYNKVVASKFNRDVQRIIDSREYQEAFNIHLGKGRDKYVRNADEFEIVNHTGSLVSVGVGGGLTSRTVDVLIMDDLYKDAMTAWSETVRASTLDWYDTVAKTRLHNDSQQLIVFTRWHEEDLAGTLLRRENDWEVVVYPAIKQGEPTEQDPRQDGEALWGEKHSLKTLEEIRKQNPIVFDSLYQQNPTPKEGLLIPASDTKRFSMAEIKDNPPDTVIMAADTADEGSDSLSTPIAYIYGDKVYIPDLIFTQDPVESTKPRVALLMDTHNVATAQFESNDIGKIYAQNVRDIKMGRTHVKWKRTTTNKHTRIIMASGDIKENFYFLKDEEQGEEYKKFFHEFTHYPKNGKVKHDDAIDSLAMIKEMLGRQIPAVITVR